MARFHQMISLVRTEEDKEREVEEMKPTVATIPDVPYGLRICLTQDELEKLDIDYSDCEVGDQIHIFGMAEVTSVSCSKSDSGENVRIELSITHMAVEDEDREEGAGQ